jgi:hypothetical protein
MRLCRGATSSLPQCPPSTFPFGIAYPRSSARRNDEFEAELEEIHELGNGVVLAVVSQNARPVGSSAHVQFRYAAVGVFDAGLAVRTTNYLDTDEARAGAGDCPAAGWAVSCRS